MAGRTLNFAITADAKDFSKAVGGAKGDISSLGSEADNVSRKVDGIGDSVAENADTVASKGSQIGGALGGIGDVLANSTNPALATMGAGLMGAGAGIQFLADSGDLVNGVVETFKNFEIVQKAQALATKVATGVQAAFNAVMSANPIALVVLAVAALVAGLVIFFTKTKTGQKIWQAFTDFLGKCVDKIKAFFTKTIPAAFQKVSDKATAVKTWVTDKFTAMVTWIKGLPGRITSAAGDLFKSIKDKATAGKTWITDKFTQAKDWFKSLPGKIGSAAGDLFKSIKTKAGDAKEWIKDKFGDVVTFVKGLPGKIASAASGMWDSIKNSFRTMINTVIGWWNNKSFSLTVPTNALTSAVGLAGKGFTINTPNIPYLANGGITTGPTLAMIGDNPGGREAVIPLDKYSLTPHVTVEAPQAITRQDLDYLAMAIVQGFEKGTLRHLDGYARTQNRHAIQTNGYNAMRRR